MTYGVTAVLRRMCTETCRDGHRCRAWALWDTTRTDGRQLCLVHAGQAHKGPQRAWDEGIGMYVPRWWPYRKGWQNREKTRYPPCTCGAYAWPHRPGGGLCRWPNAPKERSTIPAGTHAELRLRRGWATK